MTGNEAGRIIERVPREVLCGCHKCHMAPPDWSLGSTFHHNCYEQVKWYVYSHLIDPDGVLVHTSVRNSYRDDTVKIFGRLGLKL